MNNLVLLATVGFVFGHPFFASDVFAQTSAQPLEVCADVSSELLGKSETVDKIAASLGSLLGSTATYDLPLKVVFQVEFSSIDAVEKRIKELSQGVDLESVYSSLKSSLKSAKTSACTEDRVKSLLTEIATKQVEVNQKKIEFLKFEASKREALISEYEAKRKKNSDQYSIEKQLSGSREALSNAQQNLEISEVKSAQAKVGELESLDVAEAGLNKFNVDIETEHIGFVETLKTKGLELEKLQSDLAEASKNISDSNSGSAISRDYKIISEIWVVAADRILELFQHVTLESNVEMPAMVPLPTATNDAQIEKIRNYEQLYQATSERRKLLAKVRSKMLDDLKVQDFKILSDAGSLRAKLLDDCDRVGCERPLGLNAENVQIFWREVKVVPLKVLAGGLNKWIEIKAKVRSGLDGWLDLAKQVFFLILLLLIPVFLTHALRRISIQLEEAKKSLLARSMIDYRSRTNFAVWIARVNPFIPSIGMIVSIGFARVLLGKTDLRDLAGLLFYFQIFYIYRVIRLLFVIGFEVVFATESVGSIKELKYRIERTATFLAKVAFIEYVLLHVTEDSVRRALAYHFFSTVIFWINLALVFYETSYWRVEICESFKSRFAKVWERISRITASRLGRMVLPFMFAAIVVHDLWRNIARRLVRVDLVKRILSDVLRKRLENVEVGAPAGGPPPQEYLKEFDYYLSANSEIFIERENSPVQFSTGLIQDWLEGRTREDLVILVGNRGMGKTTTITHVYEDIEGKCRSMFASVPAKTTSSADFFRWLSATASHSISSVEEFEAFDRQLERKIVFCIDDIQNLFLGSIGGFEAYRLFLEVISLKSKNVFWCLTVNSRSWSYLKGVFGQEHFYGKVVSLTPWRDFEIQKLILIRHAQTTFTRSFDESIKAYGAGDSLGQQAEAQFFRLLWGQSRGNPRSALMYWVSALRIQNTNEIHVGIPSFVSSSTVGTMSDDALFVLSSIARHESLTHGELRQVTRIEDSVIRKCLKESVDRGLVWIDDNNRARISSRAQYVIDYFLIGKNFLYE